MKKDRTEQKLRERFRNFESPADFESMWGQMESKRNQNRKRRVFFWLILAGLLALGSWVSIEYVIDNEGVVVAKTENAKDFQNLSHLNKPLINDKENNVLSGLNEQSFKANPVESNENNLISVRSNKSNQPPYGQTLVVAPSQNGKENKEEISKKNEEHLDSKNENPFDIPKGKKSDVGQPQGLAPTGRLMTILKLLEISETTLNLPKLKTPETKFRKPIYQGFSVAYGTNIRNLMTDSETEKPWVDLRNDHETPLDAIFAEYTFRKYLTQNLFIQSGLGFHQSVTRRTEIRNRIYTQIKDSHLVEIIINEDGSETEVWGAAEITFYETKQYRFFNRTRSVFVPILMGFDIPFKQKKSGLSLSGGLSVSLFSEMSGKPAKNEIFPNRQFEHRTYGVLNAHGNLDFYYQISPFWRVSGGVQSVLNLNNWAKGTDYSERYHFVGLRASVLRVF